ncbi:folate family ECF transporter S component [Clostridium sp. PL3]|uniref:Folate family ECF transporter S component n=1 Tax=Clostridium thailandense TaxID=2794346 RepID=A0A949TR11_9CLOT|nr:folate family ECF transporter S component [Clostridium thailandense]MBV7273807.1 folate family ECF transporter S component [Clostridium thailandense]
MKNKMNTKFLVTTAMCISISVVLRSFSIMITAGGVLTMRVSFGAIFYILPGLLFGPLYGAAAGGIVDILGTIIMPMGAYIPVFTLTNILAGFLPALIWKKIKDVSIENLKKYYIIFFTLLTLIGIFNTLIITTMHSSYLGKMLMFMGKKAQYLGVGLILIGAIGFALLIINNIINRNNNSNYSYVYSNFFKLIISIGVSGILVSTMNTYFILTFTPALAAKGFMVLWVPRIVETLVMTIINSYAIAVLLYSYSALAGRVTKKI